LLSATSSTSSSASSASSTQSVAYRGIDVETVTGTCAVQSYAKGRLFPTIQSESESDVEPDDVPVASKLVSCSGDVAIDTVSFLSVVPQSQRETQEVGIQCNPEREDVSQQFRGEVINRQVWTGPTPRSYYCAPQVSLEHMVEAQAMIGSFELSMDVNDLADRVVNETGIIDLPQHRMCYFAVLCASQVLRSVANYYIHGADARFILGGPPSFEPVAVTSWMVF